MKSFRATALPLLCAAVFGLLTIRPANAEILVEDAWARATVAAQKASGAFMKIRSSTDAKLVTVKTAAAGVTEIHQMKMDGSVMKMKQIKALALPAGQTVELRPGGYHLMLMRLAKPLDAGKSISIDLGIEHADGKRETVTVQVPVRPLNHSGGAMKH